MRTDTSESSRLSASIVAAILAARPADADTAFDRVVPEMTALPAEKVRPVNVDVTTAVSRVLGAVPLVAALRADILRDTPNVNLAQFDKLEDYARALHQAHVCFITVGKPPDDLRALAVTAEASRRALRAACAALIRRSLIDPARLVNCKGLPGYRNVATELQMFATVLLDAWPQIQGKCCTSEQELHESKAIANAVLAYVGLRDQSPEARAKAADLRARAFTLLADAYDEVRDTINFLRRRHGDAEQIAPSLTGGRRRVRKKMEDAPPTPETLPSPCSIQASDVLVDPTTPTTTEPSQRVEPATPRTGTAKRQFRLRFSLRNPSRSTPFIQRVPISIAAPQPEGPWTMSRSTISRVMLGPVFVDDEPVVGVAYDRVLPAMKALAPDKVLKVSVDALSASTKVLGALPNLCVLRDQLAGLPGFDVTLLDNLEDYALALRDAHLYHLIAAHAPQQIRELTEEGVEIRGILHTDAMALQERGRLDSSCFEEYTGRPGAKAIANDLGILVAVLTTNWSELQGNCAIEPGELKHAYQVASRLLRLIGERDLAIPSPTETADMRARAFTVCKNAYEQVRRAIASVRWNEGDVDKVAPSLHAGRGRRRAKTEAAEAAQTIAQPQAALPPGITQGPDASPFMA